MTRREFFYVSSAAVAVAALPIRLGAQTPSGAFTPVRRGVGVFTAQGGTIGWLVNDEAVVAVDTQYARTAPLCVDGLKERSGGRAIDRVLITHHHGDHTGGIGVFQPVTTKIVSHARVPELMKKAAANQPNATAPALPGATFDRTWSEKMGDETVTARHYGPGHTGGDAVVQFERAQVVHMGDLLFHELHPRVDRPGGANIQNWITTLETVRRDMPRDTRYIAGHARAGQPVVVEGDALLQLRNYLDAALSHVRAGIAAGRPQSEIVSLATLPGFERYEAMGEILTLKGVLTAAYEELS